MLTRRATLSAGSFSDFGTLLKVLRLRARMTQRDLGLAVGYSEAQISRLEQRKRLPDPAVVAALFLPALRLGGEPDLAARLHELAVLARTSEPDADQGAPIPGAPDAPTADLSALPSPPSHEVHRTATLAEVRERLADEQRILICGLPGTGKTSLASALAREEAAHRPVCWISLTAGITTPAEAVIRLLARFLSQHGDSETAPLCRHDQREHALPRDEQLYLITTALNKAGALICLDNAHLLGDEADTRSIVEHIAGSSRASLLATSRQDIPLAGFSPIRLGGMAPDEARALVASLAGPVISAPMADLLIERTGGNPMLIRLALGQLRPDGPAPGPLIDRLEVEPGIVTFLLQGSLSGLSEPGRRLICLTSVFRHPIDLLDSNLIEESQTIGGPYDVQAGMEELRRRQLIDHPARAVLHPLVRDYVYTGIVGTAPFRRQLHQLAARYCDRVLDEPLEAGWHYARAGNAFEAADLLASRVTDLTGRGLSWPAADLAAELLATGALNADTERQLLVTQGDLLLLTDRASEAEDAYRRALASATAPAVRAGVTWRLAENLLQRGTVPEALDLCRAATAQLTENEVLLRAQLGAVQSRAHLMLSELHEAAMVAENACLAADQMVGVTPKAAAAVHARAYWVLGVTDRLRGRPGDAAHRLRRAIASARTAGLHEIAGRALFNIGAMAWELGDRTEADRLYAEALAELRPIGDGYGIGRVLHGLSLLRSQAGEQDEAIRLLDEARALKLRFGDKLGAATSEHSLALILLAQGKTEPARALLASIIESTRQMGERRTLAHYLDSLAMVDLADGDPQNARRWLAEAAEIVADVDNPSLRTELHLHTAFAFLASGDLAEAARLAQACKLEVANVQAYGISRIEHAALIAGLAVAAGDPVGATAAARDMARLADDRRDARYSEAARRLQSIIAVPRTTDTSGTTDGSAPAAGVGEPPLHARLPRLLWVQDPGTLTS